MVKIPQKVKRKYYLQYEITRYFKHQQHKVVVIRSSIKTIETGDFLFRLIPESIIAKIKELQNKYGYSIQQNITLNAIIMTEVDPLLSTLPKPLNQNVETRRITQFDQFYKDLCEYTAANQIKKPNKGIFLSHIMNVGLVNYSQEEYVKTLV